MSTAINSKREPRFTGWHMLAIMLSFFGVIFAVNFTMAYFASSSWSGLVDQDTYVASQKFNERAAAMRAIAETGVKGVLTVNSPDIHYSLAIPGEGPAVADDVKANFRRPVGEHQDFSMALTPVGPGEFTATRDIPAGQWIVEIIAKRGEDVVMHEARRFYVKPN
jgi:nitrogen fixation protein FixH